MSDHKQMAHVCVGYLKWIESRRAQHKDTSFFEQPDVIETMIAKVLELGEAETLGSLHFVKAAMLLSEPFEQIKFEMAVAKMVDGDINRRYENDPIFRKRFDKMMGMGVK